MTALPARLVGRFEIQDPTHPRSGYSNNAVVVRFEGTRLDVRLVDEGTNHFEIVVDGASRGSVATNKTRDRYDIAKGLSPGTHEIEIVRRTEARLGEVTFLGFETDGKVLDPPPPKKRRLEFLGDSITCGYGNEAKRGDCGFDSKQENGYQTYAALTARAFDADLSVIAWSGKTIREVTTYWERTLPLREDSRWDPTRYSPDAIVVNLGTNDFAITDPGQVIMRNRNMDLLDKIRAHHKDAWVFFTLGPILSDAYPEGKHRLTQARKYIRAFVQEATEVRGDTKVVLVEFDTQKVADGYGCGFHPNTTTHKKMADRLIPVIKEKLGW